MTTADSADPGDIRTDRLRAALRASASALKAGSVPFALAGSYALWVHGAPENTHDVDLVVPESAVDEAARCLADQGFTVERPPEDWLFKAYLDDAMVDILHRLNGSPIADDFIELAQPHDVLGLRIPVLPPTEVISTKLQAMSERYCDFGQLLPPVRAVRERLDWPRLVADVGDNPFARAFLFLAGELAIMPTDLLPLPAPERDTPATTSR
ncbi:MAG TPA: hypothetical protein VIU11_18085 [Nakamurella sp.]